MLKAELELALATAQARIESLTQEAAQWEAQATDAAQRLTTARTCYVEMRAEIAELKRLREPEPDRAIELAPAAGVPCNKCKGTGTYHWGAQDIATGQYEHSGQCFQCAGTGTMKEADTKRTNAYWRHRTFG